MSLPSLIVGFLPVLLFLAALIFMDSYKLVSRAMVLRAIGVGCGVALVCFGINRFALEVLQLEPKTVRWYLAPLLEELLKAAYIVYLIRAEKVGFLVDAGIQGFAVGTGFALVENLYYAGALGDRGFVLWLVRGLGTAVMHGSTTAIVAILSRELTERKGKSWSCFLPGLGLAVLIHAGFNHLFLSPLASSFLLLVAMPPLLALVFERSEKTTRDWLGTSLDSQVERLELISSGSITETHVGQYLESLKARFEGPVVADMLCLLQLYAELSVRAKGILIAREAGIELPADPEVSASFEEIRYLRKSIGPTGLMAIRPLIGDSDRDLWQLHMLRK